MICGELPRGDNVYIYSHRLKCNRCHDPIVLIAVVVDEYPIIDRLARVVIDMVNKEHRRNHRNDLFMVRIGKLSPERN